MTTTLKCDGTHTMQVYFLPVKSPMRMFLSTSPPGSDSGIQALPWLNAAVCTMQPPRQLQKGREGIRHS